MKLKSSLTNIVLSCCCAIKTRPLRHRHRNSRDALRTLSLCGPHWFQHIPQILNQIWGIWGPWHQVGNGGFLLLSSKTFLNVFVAEGSIVLLRVGVIEGGIVLLSCCCLEEIYWLCSGLQIDGSCQSIIHRNARFQVFLQYMCNI